MDIGHLLGVIFSPITTLFHYVAYQPVFNILVLIYHIVGSFGLAIVILTLLLRVALIPVTRAQLRNSRAMQQLAPALKEIQAKYRNNPNPQAMMAEQQALYKSHGVHPAGGCLPLLIQLPFLYALYYSFFAVLQPGKLANGHVESIAQHLSRVNADIYPFIPHLAHLPNTMFLGLNLAVSDPSHILPIIAALATFLQMRMTIPQPSATPNKAPDATQQTMKMMQFFAPGMTLFIALTVPAGLPLYWAFSTGFSAVQQYFINGRKFRPDPVKAPATATSAAPTTAAARASRSSASPPTVVPSEPPKGILARIRAQYDEVRKTMQEQLAAARTQTVSQNGSTTIAEPASAASSVEAATTPPTPPVGRSGSNGNRNGYNGSSARPPQGRRTAQPSRSNRPQLIKPSSALPEQRIAADAGSSENGKTVLPEDAIARDATSDDLTDDGQTR
ncbi:MAG TPA: YidC/Oxa1 family membrane protein insertase [Ktedonobacterales bacterium]